MVKEREKDKGVKDLNLSENSLGPGAVQSLCDILSPVRKSKSYVPTLVNLKLERCNLDCKAMLKLCASLHDNVTCQTLSLSRNSISSDGAFAIAEMVQHNMHIRELDLSWNSI